MRKTFNQSARDPKFDEGLSSTQSLEAFLPESASKPGRLSKFPLTRGRKSTPVLVAAIACAIAGAVAGALWLNAPSTAATPATGSLRVESDPAGADLFIDGTSRGKTPVTITLVEGKHQLLLKRGTLTQELPAVVTRNTSTVHHFTWPGVPTGGARDTGTGSVSIVSEPSTASVSVDAVNRGTTPLTVRGLAAGQHEVVIRSQGTVQRRTVRVEAGATSSLVFTRAADTGVASGWLAASVPVPLQIFEGGKLIGSTESERIMLPSGDHTFEFGSDVLGFRATRAVTIKPGQTASMDIALPRAPVNFNAAPWAQVWLDGQPLGETPIGNFMATIGSHEVIFRHPQFGERRLTAVVTLKETARVAVDMTKR